MSEMGDIKFTTAGEIVGKYFSYKNNSYVRTVSEQEILDEYWNQWYDKVCEKFGKDRADTVYSWKDCIDDWIIVNQAWQVSGVD